MYCERCHEEIPSNPKRTSESEPYCSHCGFVFGTSISPSSSWACPSCDDVKVHHGGDERPYCLCCDMPMNARCALPSLVHGAGTPHADLEMGLDILMEAQSDLLDLGSELLRDSQSESRPGC